MPPRIFRRDASTAAREKPGHLRQLPRHRHRPQVSVSPAELEKQRLRRILKAERDERMDISMSLTPVKTYVLHKYPELLFLLLTERVITVIWVVSRDHAIYERQTGSQGVHIF